MKHLLSILKSYLDDWGPFFLIIVLFVAALAALIAWGAGAFSTPAAPAAPGPEGVQTRGPESQSFYLGYVERQYLYIPALDDRYADVLLPINYRVELSASHLLSVVRAWHTRPIAREDLIFVYMIEDRLAGQEFYVQYGFTRPRLAEITSQCFEAALALGDVASFTEEQIRTFIAEDAPELWPAPFVDVVRCHQLIVEYNRR